MLKGRGRDLRGGTSPSPLFSRPVTMAQPRTPLAQRPQMKPEPDYEVVEFPSDQYVNAKLQPPPPPPPRPPTGHPVQAGASCGLCGGGGARVRCTECGRRALCASCDDMYHRHPKRRHHQRQALTMLQQQAEVRPPLPPKVAAAPVPPPRRHKMSASPKPPSPSQEPRRATLGHAPFIGIRPQHSPMVIHPQPQTFSIQNKVQPTPPSHLGSMPFLNTMPHQAGPVRQQMQTNTLGHMTPGWNRPRASLQGFNMPQMQGGAEAWESTESMGQPQQGWGRALRRGASVLELGGGGACPGCAHCGPLQWRYGSCASLDQPWPGAPWPPACCPPHAPPHHHPHHHPSQTPQPYRRVDSRAVSRAASRAGSRAASPAGSTRSRTSRRARHRTPSPLPLPSSDADSESESEHEKHPPAARRNSRSRRNSAPIRETEIRDPSPVNHTHEVPGGTEEESLGPAPAAPAAPWQCEHCTFVNEPLVRVCAVCCRTPTAAPKVVAALRDDMERLKIRHDSASPIASGPTLRAEVKVEQPKQIEQNKTKKERMSTGCGPSPPREQNAAKPATPRLLTPTRQHNGTQRQSVEKQTRHDMGVGPSPPRDNSSYQNFASEPSPLREPNKTVRVSPYRETKELRQIVPTPRHHSVSVGPSPPREPTRESPISTQNFQKKSAGTSPPRVVAAEGRSTAPNNKTNVSNTGTSPPPQSISTQTYEELPSWERPGSAARSRSRRRFRDEARRERSHSRHSLSSDTRESERSVRTMGAGWEWRERAGSPPGEGRLARRASHLDLRRPRPRTMHRDSYYGSETASPEPTSGRAMSMEALTRPRDAARGLELARLLADAEKLGYNAAEIQVALAQSPGAPLEWLRTRWAGLVGAVQGAVARLAAGAQLSESEARAALARHRGAVWPAVTECVDAIRTQRDAGRVSSASRVRGRVWGSPAGADDDAAAPRARAEDSSDEYDPPPPMPYPEEDWGFPPLDPLDHYELDRWSPVPPHVIAPINEPPRPLPATRDTEDVARKLRSLLIQAGIPSIDENLLLRGLLADGAQSMKTGSQPKESTGKLPAFDLVQSENDFIDAYNALTRASPLPNINKPPDSVGTLSESILPNVETIQVHLHKEDEKQIQNVSRATNNTRKSHIKSLPNCAQIKEPIQQSLKNIPNTHIKDEPKKAKIRILRSEKKSDAKSNVKNMSPADNNGTQRTEIKSPTPLLSSPQSRPMETRPIEANNLNDLVDNTQKLIQQMKEEINSDINSLDDGHAQTSLSEHETSSNDEREEESSYSETEERTDDITSDEKEVSSEEYLDEEAEIEENLRSNASFPTRTSSEDNEQFEEALDNLDIQIEDVKHTNIEILDSIARSLQEEHTMTIEMHVPQTDTVQDKLTIEPEKSSINKEDRNNNVFVTVNSFEEIYAELNSSKTVSNVKKETVPPQVTNQTIVSSPNVAPKINQASRSEPPQVNQSQVTSLSSGSSNIIIPALTAPTSSSERKSPPLDPIILHTKYAINQLTFKIEAPTKLLVSENKEPIFTAVMETIAGESEYNTDNVGSSAQDVGNEEIIDNRLESSPTHESNPVLNGNSVIISDLPETNVANNELESKETTLVQTEITIVEPSHSENTQNETLEKGPENPTQDSTIKTPTAKSNIPKPVKTQNIKTKLDKLAPKLLVSKVPIRRASLKQYPAPAPPKTHFGNIQSGHVKQLQSKIFNSPKPSKPQIPVTVDVKPSTSTATLSKKKPAPAPPAKQTEAKDPTPPKTSPPQEKRKNYFRETCRTEDEWTESDSEDSQSQTDKTAGEKQEEEPMSPPSPPPPLTLRRVSGQIIDLAQVQLPEGSPERQARMLLAAGALESWSQARLAVELVSRGAAPAHALLAALECTDLAAALVYLHQDCELCASRLPEHEMVSMLRCTHRCCRECARLYFTVQITERSIADCVCPYCKLPELETLPEDAWLEYFAHLDILLKTLLEADVHELFQRKLRDRTLARDPNFRWCVECSSGFFVHPKHKKLRCPECRSVSCASCRKPWSSNHEGLSCEQYATWLEDNDPELSAAAVQQHLRENGLECPRCRFKYSLSRGGCMHFTCTQCKYEFCYGCGKPFMMGARCGLSEYCAKLGLHAHHPRNCLFYLRDKEPHELQTLLQMNNIAYETAAPAGGAGRCPVQLQRETPAGLVDGVCNSEAPDNYAGLCKPHYVEYLAARARALDPIPIMDVSELVAELRRRALPLPERGPWDTDPVYAGMCAEIVREKIPLD